MPTAGANLTPGAIFNFQTDLRLWGASAWGGALEVTTVVAEFGDHLFGGALWDRQGQWINMTGQELPHWVSLPYIDAWVRARKALLTSDIDGMDHVISPKSDSPRSVAATGPTGVFKTARVTQLVQRVLTVYGAISIFLSLALGLLTTPADPPVPPVIVLLWWVTLWILVLLANPMTVKRVVLIAFLAVSGFVYHRGWFTSALPEWAAILWWLVALTLGGLVLQENDRPEGARSMS